MIHLVRNFNALRIISSFISPSYYLPHSFESATKWFLIGVSPRRRDFPIFKMGRTEIRKKTPGPEPISTGILKSQHENKMNLTVKPRSSASREKRSRKRTRWVRTENVGTHP